MDEIIKELSKEAWRQIDVSKIRGRHAAYTRIFADLVIAHEREACAAVCDKAAEDFSRNAWDDGADEKYSYMSDAVQECADLIRTRSRK